MTHTRTAAARAAVTACFPGYGMLLLAAFAAMPVLDAAVDFGAIRAGHWPLITLFASHAAFAAALIRYRRQQRALWQQWRDGGGKIIAGGQQDSRLDAVEARLDAYSAALTGAFHDAGLPAPDCGACAKPGLHAVPGA